MEASREVIEAEVEEVEDEPVGREVATVSRRESVGGLIRPVAPPSEVLAAQEDVRELIEKALKPKRDYDTIPGTGKPTLLKPGAERINAAFGCAARYTVMEREIDHDRVNQYVKKSWEWHPSIRGQKVWSEEEGESQGLYRYVLSCQLVHRESGIVIGEGVGSCSTMESKYIDRPRDLENTVLKMGKKRAYIDATLTTFGLSEQFTQDVEDMDMGAGRAAAGPFSLDDKVGFGKHKALTWAELIEKDRQYVVWALDNVDKLTPDAKVAIRDALQGNATEDAPELDEMEITALVMQVQGDLDTAAGLGIINPDASAQIERAVEARDVDQLRTAKDWLASKIEKAPFNQGEQADEAKATA